ncbi:MAG: Tfp pilus assembly protein FimT/FimU [Thermoanaerobaculia bacterium]
MRQSHGFQLIEVLVVMALASLAFMVVVPWFVSASTRLELDMAAAEVVAALRLARAAAVREGVKVGVKFREQDLGIFTFTLYRDGDGDGVRSRDIESEVDPPVGLPRSLHHMGRRIRLGFPLGPAPRDPGNRFRRLPADPIRFNRSDLASFGPLGGSTPGSIYLTDGRSLLAAVRVFGRTGKVKVIHYDVESETWR